MSDKELYLKELNEQGRTLFSCDKYAEAIKKYNQAIEEDPMYLPTYFNACEAYIMADMFDDARKMMKRVLMVEKENGEAYFHLGNIALLEEDFEEGKLQYAKAVNCNYDVPDIYINLAAVAEEEEDWEEALSYYTKAIVRDRTSSYAKIRKIQIYIMLGKTVQALNAADDLIETNPDVFEGHHLKFVILATERKFAEAEKVLDKAQRMFPDDQGFVFDRVKLYELREQYDQALDLLETMNVDQVPKEVLYIEKALIFMALKRVDEARTLLESYNGDAIVGEMQRMLITIYTEQQNYIGILKCAERLIDLEEYDSNYFAALYLKAYALKMMDKAAQARIQYEVSCKKLQEACSINSGILELYIYRAICYKELGNYDKAHEMLDYVAAVDENIAEVYYVRHLIYKDTNDERADAELNKAMEMNPDFANILKG